MKIRVSVLAGAEPQGKGSGVNVKLEAALAYARMHWRIFPCHSIVTTDRGPLCSCGRVDCNSPGKHPRTRAGFKEATDDPAQIKRWWSRWPDANIAVATGAGLVVIDIDGPEGAAEFKALVEQHGAVPATLSARTGRGLHLFYCVGENSFQIRSSARGNVHVRGEGGYVIVAPSNHVSGNNYKWLNNLPVETLPKWLAEWTQGFEISRQVTSLLGPVPSYLKGNQRDIGTYLTESLGTTYSVAEQHRIISALASIPPENYQTWLEIGMALQQLNWISSDGTDLGFVIWDEWSQKSQAKYSLAACESKWASIARSPRSGITLGTLYHYAQQHGWNPAPEPALKAVNGHAHGHANGANALPAALTSTSNAVVFPDTTEEGKPRSTMLNTKVAINHLGLDCRFDLFHNRMLVAGEIISKWNSTELSDPITQMLRDVIRYRYQFDPGKQNTQDACEILCLAKRFDPVLDYLDSLKWDGRPRLERWLSAYLGAADTELNRAIARLSLIAAVRRARRPGTKFDQIIVLEGPQGQGKSEAIEILAGPENFSDQSILGVDDRKQQELTEGVWLYEIGELSGIRRAEIEHIKAFASRKVDRARPAYGRYTVSQPRRTVFFASTNQDGYLQDDTGNRRFWPVTVRQVDHAALRRDRDQIWAEASQREAQGESHFLPEALWHAAAEEQHKRMQTDTWLELINNYLNMSDKRKDDVNINDVLCDNQFIQMKPDQVRQADAIKAGRILAQLGFQRYQKRTPEGARIWRYRRGLD